MPSPHHFLVLTFRVTQTGGRPNQQYACTWLLFYSHFTGSIHLSIITCTGLNYTEMDYWTDLVCTKYFHCLKQGFPAYMYIEALSVIFSGRVHTCSCCHTAAHDWLGVVHGTCLAKNRIGSRMEAKQLLGWECEVTQAVLFILWLYSHIVLCYLPLSYYTFYLYCPILVPIPLQLNSHFTPSLLHVHSAIFSIPILLFILSTQQNTIWGEFPEDSLLQGWNINTQCILFNLSVLNVAFVRLLIKVGKDVTWNNKKQF